MSSELTISELRKELGLTQIEFAERLGLASKGRISAIENGIEAPTFKIALKIEQLSGQRIDAGDLNEDVKAARHGLINTAAACPASNGKPQNISASQEAAA